MFLRAHLKRVGMSNLIRFISKVHSKKTLDGRSLIYPNSQNQGALLNRTIFGNFITISEKKTNVITQHRHSPYTDTQSMNIYICISTYFIVHEKGLVKINFW